MNRKWDTMSSPPSELTQTGNDLNILCPESLDNAQKEQVQENPCRDTEHCIQNASPEQRYNLRPRGQKREIPQTPFVKHTVKRTEKREKKDISKSGCKDVQSPESHVVKQRERMDVGKERKALNQNEDEQPSCSKPNSGEWVDVEVSRSTLVKVKDEERQYKPVEEVHCDAPLYELYWLLVYIYHKEIVK